MEYSSSKGPLLDDHEQEMVTTFHGTGGRPVLPRHAPNSLTRPTAKLKEFVGCHYDPAMLDDPFVALYNEPSRDKSDERRYFCEACTVRMPAREQDWQMHTSGLVHKAQIISLSQTSELGHLPSPYTGRIDTKEVTFSNPQLGYFGCQERDRLSNLQMAAMMAVLHLAGQTATRRVAPMWWNLSTDWAQATMKIACAANGEGKHLITSFRASETLCLSNIFNEKQDLQSITLTGRLSNDCSLHVADALALDKLMKALRHQPQLEALDIQFQGPYLSSDQWALDDPYLEDYRDVSDVTARMFQPAWRSACLLLQNSQMFRLRQVCLKLPHPDKDVQDNIEQVQESLQKGHQQRRLLQITALLMATHPRLGANSMLRLVPHQVMKEIIRLALPSDSFSLKVSSVDPVPMYSTDYLD